MTDTDSILNRIRTGLAKRGHKTKVSQKTGIHIVRLAAAAKPDWNPTAATMKKLEEAVAELFPGDPPETPHRPK